MCVCAGAYVTGSASRLIFLEIALSFTWRFSRFFRASKNYFSIYDNKWWILYNYLASRMWITFSTSSSSCLLILCARARKCCVKLCLYAPTLFGLPAHTHIFSPPTLIDTSAEALSHHFARPLVSLSLFLSHLLSSPKKKRKKKHSLRVT